MSKKESNKNYNTQHYNLSAIIAVGYKVNSGRAVLFRKWATQIVQEFTIKGFVMDDERLKIHYWDYRDLSDCLSPVSPKSRKTIQYE